MRNEKVKTYLAPEGTHRARIEEVQMVTDDRNGARKEGIKFIFEITSIEHYSRTYMGRKVYWQADSKTLLHDLEKLLGDEIRQIIDSEGELIEDNLPLLHNLECEIQVSHVRNPKHETPFCKVALVKAVSQMNAT